MRKIQQNKALGLIAIGAVILALPLLRMPAVTQAQKLSTDRAPASISKSAVSGATMQADGKMTWQMALPELLQSKIDNDPRLDTDYRHLTPEQHQWLISRYHQIPAEDRNQRGKIAFLIARDLRDLQDVAFLREIVEEAPCRSLGDCALTAPSDEHMAAVDQVTLHYPQMVVLYQIEKNPDLWARGDLHNSIQELLQSAERFPAANVQKRAASILQKLDSTTGPSTSL